MAPLSMRSAIPSAATRAAPEEYPTNSPSSRASLRAASELVGIMARDHVIVAAGGYFSFVEAGRWRG